jgi:hypothetical protein
MKNLPAADRPAPTKSTHVVSFLDESESILEVEFSDLSPERITEGSSDATFLLDQVTAQQDQIHQIRHWGINE